MKTNTPKTYWYELFAHMADTHGLTLLESEMDDIAHAVDRCRGKDYDKLNRELTSARVAVNTLARITFDCDRCYEIAKRMVDKG